MNKKIKNTIIIPSSLKKKNNNNGIYDESRITIIRRLIKINYFMNIKYYTTYYFIS